MNPQLSIFSSPMPATAAQLHAWHARPGAFARLTPPWQRIELLEVARSLDRGERARLRMHFGPFARTWIAEHVDHVVDPAGGGGAMFRDVQVSGPFRRFDHTHSFRPDGAERSVLEDRIEWELPLGALGRIAVPFARRELARAFGWRHRITAWDLHCHHGHVGQVGSPVMKVLVSGASGLIGSALVPFLTAGGHQVRRLVRDLTDEHDVVWHPELGEIDAARLSGFDAVVHLAGESIAQGRWTAEKKARILESRMQGTRLLCEALARLPAPPRTLVCASAIGFYGSRGDQWLDEESALGSGFLAEVCREWEAAARPAIERAIRVVHLRTGFVLSPSGGGLKQMLGPFRMGVGGVLGSGKQWMSWIALDDVLGVIGHVLETDALRGPVNVVAPEPVTNATFTKALGRVLGRPTILPMPVFAAHLVFGEVADEILLTSQRVAPKRLVASGYQFGWPSLEPALRHLLGSAP